MDSLIMTAGPDEFKMITVTVDGGLLRQSPAARGRRPSRLPEGRVEDAAVTTRRLPRWNELSPLLRLRRPDLNPTGRRLDRALCIEDLRAIARRRTPRAVFDYVDGGADGEVSLRRARDLFASLELQPGVLHDVSAPDLRTPVLGRTNSLPFAFAPTGFTRMMQHEGEVAVARVAARNGIGYALSTMGTSTIETVAAAAPEGRLWFQLYVWKDRAASVDLLARARQAGYQAVVLTVDSAVTGLRRRDLRNGFAMPPALTARTVLDGALHPHWWVNLLTTEPLQFASLRRWDRPLAELGNLLFDPSVTLDDLAWLRSAWDGPLVVKGIQTVRDAQRVLSVGADAVVLSNHGGRQLDLAPTPLRLLPEVRDAVGDGPEIWVDTGILTGSDIVAAHALGANLALVGRAYLYGLMAGGERGVERAVQILRAEVTRTMQLMGVSRISDLTPDHVRLP
nr:alpha-hydroxy acid oxidase [Microlunatus panaciterrae]